MSEYASAEWEAEERRVCDEAEQKFLSWPQPPSAGDGDLAVAFVLMRAPLHLRVHELETELQAKHDKLVRVADKLRALEDAQPWLGYDGGAERSHCAALTRTYFQHRACRLVAGDEDRVALMDLLLIARRAARVFDPEAVRELLVACEIVARGVRDYEVLMDAAQRVRESEVK